MKMQCKVLTVDIPNKNGRIYPRSIIEREIMQLEGKISERQALVYNAPDELSTSPPSLFDVIGITTDIEIKNNDVIAKVEPLMIPNAMQIMELVSNGTASLRTSGTGTLIDNKDGTTTVGDDYKLTHFIVTTDPA